jgi:hypothetical protein
MPELVLKLCGGAVTFRQVYNYFVVYIIFVEPNL